MGEMSWETDRRCQKKVYFVNKINFFWWDVDVVCVLKYHRHTRSLKLTYTEREKKKRWGKERERERETERQRDKLERKNTVKTPMRKKHVLNHQRKKLSLLPFAKNRRQATRFILPQPKPPPPPPTESDIRRPQE